jgi:hypothetical protein
VNFVTAAIAGLVVLGCRASASRPKQVETCEIISHSGEEVTRCLVIKYDWDGKAALGEGLRWQGHLDSVAAQLAAVQAEEERRARDSARATDIGKIERWIRCASALEAREALPTSYGDAVVHCGRAPVEQVDTYETYRELVAANEKWFRVLKQARR